MKVQRILRIIQILGLRRTPVVAEQLALELQVSIRTIYRDIQDLKSVGLPVEGEPGLGYQLGKGYFLPNFHFDADELDSVLIGLQLVRSKIDDPILTAAAQRVLAKVSLGLDGQNQHHVHSMPFKSVSSQLHQHQHPNRQYLKVVRAAIRHNTYLHLTYQDRQAQLSFRTVRPLGLTFFDEAWLLTAWCELRQDFRNFRLDHLQACTQLSHHFFNDSGKTFADYLKTLP